ncbi:MAG: stage III sporulation protein AE, partial [Clostridiales bacterium]|nr:stage III sporulation protein AE [Clostridiales bacterium]
MINPLPVPASERILAEEDFVGEDNTEAENAGDSAGENSLAAEEDSAALSEDIEDLTEALLDELNLDAVDDVLAENELTQDISFSDIVTGILDADTEISAWDVWKEARPLIFSDAAEFRSILVRILILTIAFAFFHNFIDVFENSQISRTGFYLFFLVLMVLLIQSYRIVSGMFEEVMSQTVAMMEAVIPAFSMTLIFASAQTTAAAFYQIAVGVIWLVEQLLASVVAPVIHIFAVLQMLNCLTGEKMISRLTALIRNLIRWSLRALLAGVTGINVVETMIAPSVDNLKKMSVAKVLGMIPG